MPNRIRDRRIIMSAYKLYYDSKDSVSQKFIDELEAQGVEYEKVDVSESEANRQEFEAFKARRMEFEPFKQWGQSGLPAVLLPNNRIIFELIDLNGTSCSLTPRD